MADAPRLAFIHMVTWQVAYHGIFPDEFFDSFQSDRRIAWWRRMLGGGASVLVAELDDQVVGYCWVGASDDDGWGEVFSIYVHPDHWGGAHGHHLLRAGASVLRARGFERALLWVLEANQRGRAFYERQGWSRGKPIRVEEIGGVQVTEVRYETDL